MKPVIVLESPKLGTIYRGTRGRYLFRRLPYSIIYQITAEELRVIAVAQSSRDARS